MLNPFAQPVELSGGTGRIVISQTDLDAYRSMGARGSHLLAQRLSEAWRRLSDRPLPRQPIRIPGPGRTL